MSVDEVARNLLHCKIRKPGTALLAVNAAFVNGERVVLVLSGRRERSSQTLIFGYDD
jgi:hypothetical protein